jgi:hypothetical protein
MCSFLMMDHPKSPFQVRRRLQRLGLVSARLDTYKIRAARYVVWAMAIIIGVALCGKMYEDRAPSNLNGHGRFRSVIMSDKLRYCSEFSRMQYISEYMPILVDRKGREYIVIHCQECKNRLPSVPALPWNPSLQTRQA